MKSDFNNSFICKTGLFGIGLLSMTANESQRNGIPVKALIADLKGVQVKGKASTPISRLALDSRKVIPGTMFFAIKGYQSDGKQFITDAVSRGAVAIVTDKPVKGLKGVCVVVVEDVRKAMAVISRNFYEKPDEALDVIGVTGTNGKTTVTNLAQLLLKKVGDDVGLIGTIKYDLGRRTLPSSKTTPEAVDLYAMLDQMRRFECKHVVMEMSSHGIALQRLTGLRNNVAVFLNLTQDHLDFHGTMEDYYQEKKKLFTGELGHKPEIAIINLDDPYGKRLTQDVPDGQKVITFGTTANATLRAENIRLEANGTTFDLVWMGGRLNVKTHLLGHYNVLNTLAALSIAWVRGVNLREASNRLLEFSGVPGRMQLVEVGQPFTVVVDYAHTDDALKNGLTMLRQVTKGRVITVFGCGGNRDKTKRPKMMEAVESISDIVFATADNPRREAIEAIFEDMKAGMSTPEKVSFIADRRTAIFKAIEQASEGDCVLIAGKGHENYQELFDTVIPFDDCQVARELLKYRFSALV